MPTYTFDPGLSELKDEVRFRLGDTDGTPKWYLADETIEAVLEKGFSYDEACAQCAEAMASYFTQQAAQTQQRNLRLQYNDRSKFYTDLAATIRENAQPDPTESLDKGAYSGQMCAPDLSAYPVHVPVVWNNGLDGPC